MSSRSDRLVVAYAVITLIAAVVFFSMASCSPFTVAKAEQQNAVLVGKYQPISPSVAHPVKASARPAPMQARRAVAEQTVDDNCRAPFVNDTYLAVDNADYGYGGGVVGVSWAPCAIEGPSATKPSFIATITKVVIDIFTPTPTMPGTSTQTTTPTLVIIVTPTSGITATPTSAVTSTPDPTLVATEEPCTSGNPGNLSCNGSAGEDPNNKGTMPLDSTATPANGENGNKDVGGNSTATPKPTKTPKP
jgi:hypothetical protein